LNRPIKNYRRSLYFVNVKAGIKDSMLELFREKSALVKPLRYKAVGQKTPSSP